MGFPRPQPFQLKMTKREDGGVTENPKWIFKKLSLQVAEGERETPPKHSKIT